MPRYSYECTISTRGTVETVTDGPAAEELAFSDSVRQLTDEPSFLYTYEVELTLLPSEDTPNGRA